MALASVATVKKTVTTEIDEEVIQLALSKTEARALWALTMLIYSGDNAESTYKRETESIKTALSAGGKLGMAWRTDYFYVDDDGDVRAKNHLAGDK